jgi:aspartate kinase
MIAPNMNNTHKIVVQKYGGSSVADALKIGNVANRICRRRDEGVHLVVVVSAMGDTTDDLIKLARDVVGPHSAPDRRAG